MLIINFILYLEINFIFLIFIINCLVQVGPSCLAQVPEHSLLQTSIGYKEGGDLRFES